MISLKSQRRKAITAVCVPLHTLLYMRKMVDIPSSWNDPYVFLRKVVNNDAFSWLYKLNKANRDCPIIHSASYRASVLLPAKQFLSFSEFRKSLKIEPKSKVDSVFSVFVSALMSHALPKVKVVFKVAHAWKPWSSSLVKPFKTLASGWKPHIMSANVSSVSVKNNGSPVQSDRSSIPALCFSGLVWSYSKGHRPHLHSLFSLVHLIMVSGER